MERKRREKWEKKILHISACAATHPHPNKHTSANHSKPHTSLLLREALSHFLTPHIFGCHVTTMLKKCIHTLHRPTAGSNVKGCLRERRKNLTNEILLKISFIFGYLHSEKESQKWNSHTLASHTYVKCEIQRKNSNTNNTHKKSQCTLIWLN